MSFASFNFPSSESLAPREPEEVQETSAAILRAIKSDDDPTRLKALQRLRKISFHESNRVLLVSTDSGLISALVEALGVSSDECRELILRVLADLSSCRGDTKREIVLLNPHICHVLLGVVRGEDPINHLAALTVLRNLSEDNQNAVYLMSSTLGLLSNLFELVHFEPGESRLMALQTLLNLTSCVHTPRQATIDVSDMVVVLVSIMSSDREAAVLMSLKILINLYNASPDDEAFSPAHVGFVSILASICRTDRGEFFSCAMGLVNELSVRVDNVSELASEEVQLLDCLNVVLRQGDCSEAELRRIVRILFNISPDPLCAHYAATEGTLIYNLFDIIYPYIDDGLIDLVLQTIANLFTNMEAEKVSDAAVALPTLCEVIDRYMGSTLALALEVAHMILLAAAFSSDVRESQQALCQSLVNVIKRKEESVVESSGVNCAGVALSLLQLMASRPGYVTYLYNRELGLLDLLTVIVATDRTSLRPIALVTLLNLSAQPEAFQYVSSSPAELLAGLLAAMEDEGGSGIRDVALEVLYALSKSKMHADSFVDLEVDIVHTLVSILDISQKNSVRALGLLNFMARRDEVVVILLSVKATFLKTIVASVFEGIKLNFPDYQYLGMKLLVRLSSSSKFHIISEAGIVELLPRVMQMDSKDLVILALTVLNSMLVNSAEMNLPAMCTLVNTSDIRSALCYVMTQPSQESLELCLSFLQILSEHSDEQRQLLCSDQMLFLALLQDCGVSGNEITEQLALTIVYNLSAFDRNIPLITSADYNAIAVLTKLIGTRKDRIRLTALGILLHLTGRPDTIKYVSSSPIDLLTALLTVLREDSGQARGSALTALYDLMQSIHYLAGLVSIGGRFLDSIVLALTNERGEVRSIGLRILADLSMRPAMMEHMSKMGTEFFHFVTTMLRESIEMKLIKHQLLCLTILKSISMESCNAALLVLGNVKLMDPLREILSNDDSQLATSALSILHNIIENSEDKYKSSVLDALNTNELRASLHSVIKRFTEEAQQQSLLFVEALAKGHAETKRVLCCDSDLCGLLVTLIRKGSLSASAEQVALNILFNLSLSDANAARLSGADYDIISALVKIVAVRRGPARHTALGILLNLTIYPEAIKFLSSTPLDLIASLLSVLREDGGEVWGMALKINQSMCESPAYLALLLGRQAGFIKLLVDQIATDSNVRLQCCEFLWLLTEKPKGILCITDRTLIEMLLLCIRHTITPKLLPAGDDAAVAERITLMFAEKALAVRAYRDCALEEYGLMDALISALKQTDTDALRIVLRTLHVVFAHVKSEKLVSMYLKYKFESKAIGVNEAFDLLTNLMHLIWIPSSKGDEFRLAALSLVHLIALEHAEHIAMKRLDVCEVIVSILQNSNPSSREVAFQIVSALTEKASNIEYMMHPDIDLVNILAEVLNIDQGPCRDTALSILVTMSGHPNFAKFISDAAVKLISALLVVIKDSIGPPRYAGITVLRALLAHRDHLLGAVSLGVYFVDCLLHAVTSDGSKSFRIHVLSCLMQFVEDPQLIVFVSSPSVRLLSALQTVGSEAFNANEMTLLKSVLCMLRHLAACVKLLPDFFADIEMPHMLLTLAYSGDPEVALMAITIVETLLLHNDKKLVIAFSKLQFRGNESAPKLNIFDMIGDIFRDHSPEHQVICLRILESLTSTEVKENLHLIIRKFQHVVSVLIYAGQRCEDVSSKERALKVLCNLSSCRHNVAYLVSSETAVLDLLTVIVATDRTSLLPIALVTLLNLSAQPEAFQYASSTPAELLAGLLAAMEDEGGSGIRDVALEVLYALSKTAAHMTFIITAGSEVMFSLLHVIAHDKKMARALSLKFLLELSDSSAGLPLVIIHGKRLLRVMKQVVLDCVDSNDSQTSMVVFKIICNVSKVASIRALFTSPEVGLLDIIVVMLTCDDREIVNMSVSIVANLVDGLSAEQNSAVWFNSDVLTVLSSLFQRMEYRSLVSVFGIFLKLSTLDYMCEDLCKPVSGVIDVLLSTLTDEKAPVESKMEALRVIVNLTGDGRNLQWACDIMGTATDPLCGALTAIAAANAPTTRPTPENGFLSVLELRAQIVLNLSRSPACCKVLCGAQAKLRAVLNFFVYCINNDCGVPSALKAMSGVTHACGNMTFPDDTVISLVAALLEAMQKMSERSVSEAVLNIIANIFSNRKNVNALVDSDGIDIMAILLTLHASDVRDEGGYGLDILRLIKKIVGSASSESVMARWVLAPDDLLAKIVRIASIAATPQPEKKECLIIIDLLLRNSENAVAFVSTLDSVKTLMACLNAIVRDEASKALRGESLDIYCCVIAHIFNPERNPPLPYLGTDDFNKTVLAKLLKQLLLLIYGQAKGSVDVSIIERSMRIILWVTSHENSSMYLMQTASESHLIEVFLRMMRRCHCTPPSEMEEKEAQITSKEMAVSPQARMSIDVLKHFGCNKDNVRYLAHAFEDMVDVFSLTIVSERITARTLAEVLAIVNNILSQPYITDDVSMVGMWSRLLGPLFQSCVRWSQPRLARADSEDISESPLHVELGISRVIYLLTSTVKLYPIYLSDMPAGSVDSFIANLLHYTRKGGQEAGLVGNGHSPGRSRLCGAESYRLMLGAMTHFSTVADNCSWLCQKGMALMDVLAFSIQRGAIDPLCRYSFNLLDSLCSEDLNAHALSEYNDHCLLRALVGSRVWPTESIASELKQIAIRVVGQFSKNATLLPTMLSDEMKLVAAMVPTLHDDIISGGDDFIFPLLLKFSTVINSNVSTHELLEHRGALLTTVIDTAMEVAIDHEGKDRFPPGFESSGRRLNLLTTVLQIVDNLLAAGAVQRGNISELLRPGMQVLQLLTDALRDYADVETLCLTQVLVKMATGPPSLLGVFTNPDTGLMSLLADWLLRIKHESRGEEKISILTVIKNICRQDANARFLLAAETDFCLLSTIVDVIKKFIDSDTEQVILCLAIILSLARYKQFKAVISPKRSILVNLLVLLAEQRGGEETSGAARQILVEMGESERLFDFPDYFPPTQNPNGSHDQSIVPHTHSEAKEGGAIDFDQPSDGTYDELLQMVAGIKPTYPTSPLKQASPVMEASNQYSGNTSPSPGDGRFVEASHPPPLSSVSLDTYQSAATVINMPAACGDVNYIAESYLEDGGDHIVNNRLASDLSNIADLVQNTSNIPYLGSDQCRLLSWCALIYADRDIQYSDEWLPMLLEILRCLAKEPLNAAHLISEQYHLLPFLVRVLRGGSDLNIIAALHVISALCAGAVRRSQVMEDVVAAPGLVKTLAALLRERTDVVRCYVLESLSAMAMCPYLSPIILAENLDVTLMGFLLKSRRNPKAWDAENSVESAALICIMHLSQWSECARVFKELGLPTRLQPVAQYDNIHGLRAYTTLALLLGSSEIGSDCKAISAAAFEYEVLANQLRFGLSQFLPGAQGSEGGDGHKSRRASNLSVTTGPTTSSHEEVSEGSSLRYAFDGHFTADICLAAISALSICDLHKQGLATPKVMNILTAIVRIEVVILSHRPPAMDQGSLTNSRHNNHGRVIAYSPYQRLQNALEIILQLSMVHENNDMLKRLLISDKLELGPQLMSLLNLDVPADVKSQAQCMLIRLRPCTVLIDFAAAEQIRAGESPTRSAPRLPLLSYVEQESKPILDCIHQLEFTLKSMGHSLIHHPSGLAIISNMVFGTIKMEGYYENAGCYLLVIGVSRKYCASARCRMECNFAKKFIKKKQLKIIFVFLESDLTPVITATGDRLSGWMRSFIGDSSWLPLWDESHVHKVADRIVHYIDTMHQKKKKPIDPYAQFGSPLPHKKSDHPPRPVPSPQKMRDSYVEQLLSKSENKFSISSPVKRGIDIMNHTYSPSSNPLFTGMASLSAMEDKMARPLPGDEFRQAWDILNNASNVMDQAALDEIVEHIGLNDANDLRQCEKADVLQLTRTLKKVQQKNFLDTLFGKGGGK